jgi:tousled-like kinase
LFVCENQSAVTEATMSDDMLVHFSSNSSNQSDQSLPTKIAKLEARMVGKGSSSASQQQGWSSVSSAGKFSGAAVEDLVEPCTSSDSDDDVSFIHFYQAQTLLGLGVSVSDTTKYRHI